MLLVLHVVGVLISSKFSILCSYSSGKGEHWIMAVNHSSKVLCVSLGGEEQELVEV
jgi:hypothetical protein